MDAELGHLRHFFEVARQGGFTRAAAILRAQQPNMSRSVRLLEDRLGVRLIDRGGRRFALTTAGARVFAACVRIFADVEQITRIAEEERGALAGPLRIAAGGVLASRVIPEALAHLTVAHPRLWPMVFVSPASMGMARMAMAYRFVVRKDRAKHRATLASFIGSREVEDPRATKFPTLDRLRSKVPEAQIRISSNDVEAHLRMVESGLGVSILPELLVADGLARGRLVDVFRGERYEFPVLVVMRRTHMPTAGARALLDSIRAQLKPRAKRRGL
jgi:DNA-binding transcriptional LysR family regulator